MAETEREALARRLREAREYRGFSQEQVAKFLGIPRSAVSLLETGARKVEATELTQLARLYECRLEQLTGDVQTQEDDESIRMVARAAAELKPEDREEILRFAEYLRERRARE